jgi:hypothetical protein
LNLEGCGKVNQASHVTPREDPAERVGYLRFFYRGWRPTRIGRLWSRVYAWVCGLGLLPRMLLTLQTKDRASGRVNGTILVVASDHGQRYLVSMLGEASEWVSDTASSPFFSPRAPT